MIKLRAPTRLLGVCALAIAAIGCDVKLADPDLDLTPDLDAGFGDLGDLEDEAREQLRKLFPDLSASEIEEVRGKLSASELLALRAELEKVRKEVAEFSGKLFQSAEERVAERKRELEPHNGGFPDGLAAVGHVCSYDSAAQRGEIRLSGVFNGREAVVLDAAQVELRVDGTAVPFSLECLAGGPPVDIVFLIDITGSMSNVIDSVRDSVVSFVDLIESSGIRGTLSVVTFQDSVGVNRTFQQPSPPNEYERSPFFAPVSLDDASDVAALRAFVNRLEANRGADAPENLAAAIDFARNNVIGYTSSGAANVIGDRREDPALRHPLIWMAQEGRKSGRNWDVRA